MVRREDNIDLLNRIANDADVRPFIRPDGDEMDFSPIAGKRSTEIGGVVLSNGEDAVGLFEITTPTSFQAHTLFGPTCRGRRAIDTAREMIQWMFDHGAETIWGATPRDNRRACMFNRLVGAKETGGDETHAIFTYGKTV